MKIDLHEHLRPQGLRADGGRARSTSDAGRGSAWSRCSTAAARSGACARAPCRRRSVSAWVRPARSRPPRWQTRGGAPGWRSAAGVFWRACERQAGRRSCLNGDPDQRLPGNLNLGFPRASTAKSVDQRHARTSPYLTRARPVPPPPWSPPTCCVRWVCRTTCRMPTLHPHRPRAASPPRPRSILPLPNEISATVARPAP